MAEGVKKVISSTNILQWTYNTIAKVLRVSSAGLNWTPLGLADSAVRINLDSEPTSVRVCNITSSWHYVAFGDSSVAAPTGGSDGIGVPPNSCVVINSANNTHIRADGAGFVEVSKSVRQ